jgi:anti-sigma regulatory factor (Ser/Thr protein kinase)
VPRGREHAPENRRLDLRLAPDSREVGEARRALEELGLPTRLLHDARLLVTELIANAIRHAGLSPGDEIRITARWARRVLRVDVFDRDPSDAATPVSGSIRPLPSSESGWGLYLVERLSTRWGATPGRYWFEIEAD